MNTTKKLISSFLLLLVTALAIHAQQHSISYKARLNQAYVNGENKTDNVDGMLYKDSIFSFLWSQSVSSLNFTLINSDSKPISILWDQSYYIGLNGEKSGVIHKGITLDNSQKPQEPTVVQVKGSIYEVVIPKSLIEGDSALGYHLGKLFIYPVKTNEEAFDYNESIENSKVTVALALKVGEGVELYTFVFTLIQPIYK